MEVYFLVISLYFFFQKICCKDPKHNKAANKNKRQSFWVTLAPGKTKLLHDRSNQYASLIPYLAPNFLIGLQFSPKSVYPGEPPGLTEETFSEVWAFPLYVSNFSFSYGSFSLIMLFFPWGKPKRPRKKEGLSRKCPSFSKLSPVFAVDTLTVISSLGIHPLLPEFLLHFL